VVIEEINSYSDLPAELIFDQFEELAFEGHPLAHNILGTKRNVRRFTPERLRGHMERNYTPSRMVISVVGDVEFSRLVRMCERYFGAFGNHASAVDRGAKPVFRNFERTVHKRTHQAHILIGCEAPDIYNADKTAFTLINNILGGPAMNSRLNVSVRERYGFCYSVESQYVPFSDTGLFYIYAGVDLDAQERAIGLIRRELERMASVRLTPQQLRQAQRQFIGQMAINNDNGSNEMQSIGKACLNFEHVDTLEEMNADIMNLTPDEVLRVAQSRFAPDGISVLIYN
jgi:predicted Zn-dependent peptidase